MIRYFLVALVLPLAATPIVTDTGSASVECVLSSVGGPYLTQTQSANGPGASVGCQPNYANAGAGGSSVGLTVSGGSRGASPLMTWAFSGQMQDSATETSSSGNGIEEFDISFSWDAVVDPGGDAFARGSLLYNGAVIWSENHAPTSMDGPITSTAVVDVPFTSGVPFSFTENVSVNGGYGDGSNVALYSDGPIYVDQYAYASLLVTEHDPPVNVPEPSCVFLTALGVVIVIRRHC